MPGVGRHQLAVENGLQAVDVGVQAGERLAAAGARHSGDGLIIFSIRVCA